MPMAAVPTVMPMPAPTPPVVPGAVGRTVTAVSVVGGRPVVRSRIVRGARVIDGRGRIEGDTRKRDADRNADVGPGFRSTGDQHRAERNRDGSQQGRLF